MKKSKTKNRKRAAAVAGAATCSASPVEVLTVNNCEKYPPTEGGGILDAFSMAAARAMGLKRDGIKVEVKWKP